MSEAVAIAGIGLITARCANVADLAAACAAAEAAPVHEAADVPPPPDIAAREVRRMGRLARLALYAADAAYRSGGSPARSETGILVGLTHGTTSLLREFHDFLFDYGPQMASPGAFSNGVTNAALGAVSQSKGITGGGATLVGIESCGMRVMIETARALQDGAYRACLAGGAEEYSPLVAGVYEKLGWYCEQRPPSLPYEGQGAGFGQSEAGVFFALSPAAGAAPQCLFMPLDKVDDLDVPVDLVISGAGGGPNDRYEFEALRGLAGRLRGPVPILFSKPFFGETFAAGGMLSCAIAWDILVNRSPYPLYPLHPDLNGMFTAAAEFSAIRSIVVISAGRDGDIAAGLLFLDKQRSVF